MVIRMTRNFGLSAMSLAISMMLISCGNDDGVIGLAGNTQAGTEAGEALYGKAKGADDSGNTKKAAKLYEEVADVYPMSPSASKARLRQAEILEQQGKIVESFEAYQKFITRYQGSGSYAYALGKQAEMAHAAADGKVKSSRMFMKRAVSSEKVIEMLGQVRDNAPRSQTSAKAQFTIGQVHEREKDSNEAIAAYRKLVRDQPGSGYSPDALFRVGEILLAEADRGNRNQATLALAEEAFNDYLIQYPGHSKNGEARRLLGNARGREVSRSLEIAEYYDRTGQIESAKVYYREVLKKMNSGSEYDKAKSRLKELGE